MKLFHKIALLALSVALVPLAALGFELVRAQRDAVKALLEERELAVAHAAAERISRLLTEIGARVQMTAHLVDTQTLTGDERLALMRAVYQTAEDLVSVTWLGSDGAELAPRVALTENEVKQRPGRVPVSVEQLSVLKTMIVNLATLPVATREVLLSEPFTMLGRKAPSIVITLCPDVGCRSRLFVEVSLRAAERALVGTVDGSTLHGSTLQAALLSRDGKVQLYAGAPLGPGLDLSKLEPGKIARFVGASGQTQLGAYVILPAAPLSLLVYQSEESAFAIAHAMQTRTLVGLLVSAVLSIGAGFFASRALRQRLLRYELAARAMGGGRLDTRVVVDTADELGLLGDTLNTMATALEKSQAALEAFNRDLQALVDARTAALRQAQARLVLSARAAAVGQLGAGVAHEIGNPLARIMGHAQLMKLDPALKSEGRDSLERIEAAAHRVDWITKRLLRFSETQAFAPEDVSLGECAEEAAELVRGQLEAKGLTLVLEQQAPAMIRGQRAQLVQALFQLLDNAKNATPVGGTVTVRAEGGTLCVRDTGQGIAPEHLERLFDPFFTTKVVWESPGLGLSLVYRVVEDHGAQISVQSAPAQGTEVRILFAVS